MQKRETELQQLVAGTQKNLPATSTVDVNGQELKQTDIVAKLQSWIPLFQQVDATNAPYRDAQKALQAAAPAIRQYVGLYRLALRQVFGKGSPLLAALASRPPQKPAPGRRRNRESRQNPKTAPHPRLPAWPAGNLSALSSRGAHLAAFVIRIKAANRLALAA